MKNLLVVGALALAMVGCVAEKYEGTFKVNDETLTVNLSNGRTFDFARGDYETSTRVSPKRDGATEVAVAVKVGDEVKKFQLSVTATEVQKLLATGSVVATDSRQPFTTLLRLVNTVVGQEFVRQTESCFGRHGYYDGGFWPENSWRYVTYKKTTTKNDLTVTLVGARDQIAATFEASKLDVDYEFVSSTRCGFSIPLP